MTQPFERTDFLFERITQAVRTDANFNWTDEKRLVNGFPFENGKPLVHVFAWEVTNLIVDSKSQPVELDNSTVELHVPSRQKKLFCVFWFPCFNAINLRSGVPIFFTAGRYLQFLPAAKKIGTPDHRLQCDLIWPLMSRCATTQVSVNSHIRVISAHDPKNKSFQNYAHLKGFSK